MADNFAERLKETLVGDCDGVFDKEPWEVAWREWPGQFGAGGFMHEKEPFRAGFEAADTEWHPYPKEKPPLDGSYLVTTEDGVVLEDEWIVDAWLDYSVISWAFKPAPYVPKEDEK